jgi:glycerol uptake facilitator protein
VQSPTTTTTPRQQQQQQLVRELVAEAFGTFFIVALGLGSVMSAVYTNSLVGLFQVAMVWVFAVIVAICTTASISGAHLNPAVSVALALVRPNATGSFGWSKVIPFTAAQLVGAMTGAFLNLCLYAGTIVQFEAANGIVRSSLDAVASAKAFGQYFSAPVTVAHALFVEATGTAVLVAAIFALTHPSNTTTQEHPFLIPPAIGITVGALICAIAPLTQAGFNPARDFGPRIVAFLAGWRAVAFRHAWVYIVGPIVGAILGALFVDKILYATVSSENRK